MSIILDYAPDEQGNVRPDKNTGRADWPLPRATRMRAPDKGWKRMAELTLAHSVGTAVEEAYLRSDLFEKRRAIMQDWAAWCTGVHPVLPDGRNEAA